MKYKDNVEALCDRMLVKNPQKIEEHSVAISRLIFFTYGDRPSSNKRLDVPMTDMNRAGRLYVQSLARGKRILTLEDLRSAAADFFTPELWDDCSHEKRTLVFGMKTATVVEIIYK